MQRSVQRPGWTEHDGVMTGTVTNDRLLVLPAKFWTSAKLFLEEAYGDSVNLILNRFALEVGLSYGEMLKAGGMKPEEAFRVLSEMATVAGWGKVDFSGDVARGTEFLVEITGCAFCPAESAGKNGKCDFIAGVAEGLAKATYGSEYKNDHLDVTGEGVKKCILHVGRVKESDGDWKRTVYFPWIAKGSPLAKPTAPATG